MFVHIGIVHLIVNMLALLDVGKVIERLYGSQKFLIIYFLSGIAGSLTSLLWHPMAMSAGASAAVFGVIGAEFIYVWVHHKYFTAAAIHAHYGALAMLVAYSLIAAYLNIPLDHAAHIGGFACGILAGFALIPRVMSNVRWQLEDIPRFALLLLGLSSMGELTRQHLEHLPAEKISPIMHPRSKHHAILKHLKSQHSDNSGELNADQNSIK
jgi:membrane associated rhomboid family serine protease